MRSHKIDLFISEKVYRRAVIFMVSLEVLLMLKKSRNEFISEMFSFLVYLLLIPERDESLCS